MPEPSILFTFIAAAWSCADSGTIGAVCRGAQHSGWAAGGVCVGAGAVLDVTVQAVKFAGAAYLISLGIKTLMGWDAELELPALNPKTALFFLAFLPQFIHRNAAQSPRRFFC